MDEKTLKDRSKNFGLRIIRMIDSLPKTTAGRAISNQLVRSATSVGANYRAVCRAKSKADFIAKLGIVVEEIDECCYWLEIIIESGMLDKKLVSGLNKEANELAAIFIASCKTATLKNQQSKIKNQKSFKTRR